MFPRAFEVQLQDDDERSCTVWRQWKPGTSAAIAVETLAELRKINVLSEVVRIQLGAIGGLESVERIFLRESFRKGLCAGHAVRDSCNTSSHRRQLAIQKVQTWPWREQSRTRSLHTQLLLSGTAVRDLTVLQRP